MKRAGWRLVCVIGGLAAGLLLSPHGAGAQAGQGPIPVRNARPYNLLFLQFEPEPPDVLAAGQTRISARLDMANTLLAPAPVNGVTVEEDTEVERLGLSWRRGLGSNTEVGVFLPIAWRNGGFMDPILSAWHHLWGIGGNGPDNPAGRDAFPDFQSVVRLTDAGGHTVVDAGSAFGPGDLTLTAKRTLGRATHRGAAAVRAGLKLPTGNAGTLLGSGGVDAGLILDGRYNFGRDFIVYGSAGGTWQGHATRVPARSTIRQWVVALEYRANGRDSYVWQVDGSDAPVRTGNPLADGPQTTATFGYRRALGSGRSLFVSFSENGDIHNYTLPWLSNIGPDFTATVGFEWQH